MSCLGCSARGIPVGIATGRGKSVRERLQEALPRDLWERVVVGYYNGADIGLLSDDSRPDGTKAVSEPLRPVEELLVRQIPFLGSCETELRPWQITLKPAASMALDRLWRVRTGTGSPSRRGCGSQVGALGRCSRPGGVEVVRGPSCGRNG